MTNKQLFKEAIAEAKSIREAAIINAKEALEETLTPQIKSLLAQRLAEMEEEDMEENSLAEADDEKEEEATEETPEGEEEEAEGGSEDEDIDVASMSADELKDLIRDIVGQMVDLDGDGDHDMEDRAMEEPAGEEAPEDMMSADEEEIDLDELLRELSESEEEEYTVGYWYRSGPKGDEKEHDTVKVKATSEKEAIEKAKKQAGRGRIDSTFKVVTNKTEAIKEAVTLKGKPVNLNSIEIGGIHKDDHPDFSDAYMTHAEFEDGTPLTDEELEQFEQENYDLTNELIHDRQLFQEGSEQVAETLDPQTIEMIAAALGPLVVGAGAFAIDKAMAALKGGKAGEAGKKLAAHLEAGGQAAGSAVKSGMSKGTMESTDLQEALKTVKKLRTELQEVNLLNAKLLYVNKIFKTGKNLSEAQKANIISTFDKATSAKEAQLVYESLKTTLNTVKPVGKITEARLGMASKSIGTPVKKVEIIAEVSDAVKRMQKLAGIIK